MVLQSQFCLTISVRVFHAVSYAHVLYGIVISSIFNRGLNIMKLPSRPPAAHPVAENQFSQRLVLMQKEVVGECCRTQSTMLKFVRKEDKTRVNKLTS